MLRTYLVVAGVVLLVLHTNHKDVYPQSLLNSKNRFYCHFHLDVDTDEVLYTTNAIHYICIQQKDICCIQQKDIQLQLQLNSQLQLQIVKYNGRFSTNNCM